MPLNAPIRATSLALLLTLAAAGCTTAPSNNQSTTGPTTTADPYNGMHPLNATPADAWNDPAGPSGGTVTQAGGMTIRHDDWSALGYRWDWSAYPTIARGASIREVVPAGDRLLVQDTATLLSVLNSATGSKVWATEMDRPKTRFVGNARLDDTIISCSESELFIVELNTGNLLDRQKFAHVVNTPPVLAQNNLAFFGAAEGFAIAHDHNFRLELWRYGIEGPVDIVPLLIDPNTIALVSQKGDVLFLNVRQARSVGRASISGGLSTNPVTDGYRLFVASLDQSVYCFLPEEGQRLWRYRTAHPLRTQPTYHDGSLYVGTAADGLVALDANSGEPRWNNKTIANAEVVAVRGGELIAFNGTTLWAVDPDNGDIISKAGAKGIKAIHTDRLVDGTLFVQTTGGAIVRFSPR